MSSGVPWKQIQLFSLNSDQYQDWVTEKSLERHSSLFSLDAEIIDRGDGLLTRTVEMVVTISVSGKLSLRQ